MTFLHIFAVSVFGNDFQLYKPYTPHRILQFFASCRLGLHNRWPLFLILSLIFMV